MPHAIARFTKCSIFIFDPRYDSPLLIPSDSLQSVSIVFNGRSDGAAHYDAVEAIKTHGLSEETESHRPLAEEENKGIEDSEDEFYSSCVFPYISCCRLRCYKSFSVEMIM